MPGNNLTGSRTWFRKINSGTGFTLIEMLLVVALFALLGTVIMNVYLLALSAQRQTAARQEVASNIRYAVETISRQIRTGEINYTAAYDADSDFGIQDSEQDIYLTDADGNQYAYFVENGELKVSFNNQLSALTSITDVRVVDLMFYIDPPTDPFSEERCNDALAPTGCLATAPTRPECTINDSNTTERLGFCQCTSNDQCASQNCDAVSNFCLPINRQPRVTMIIGFESAATRNIEVKRLQLQTTVISRTYRR